MNQDSVARFWDNFIEKTKAYGVKDSAVRWHVKHAEQYIKAYPNHKLSAHPAQFVEKYLNGKSRNFRLEEWQYQQIVDALEILFTKMVQVPWARDFDWKIWKNKFDCIDEKHPTVSRDYQSIDIDAIKKGLSLRNEKEDSLFHSVFQEFPELIQDVIV